jgi:hypothetical protein
MKQAKSLKAVVALGCWMGSLAAAFGAMSVSVDMDLATPGIQSTRAASTGETFTAGIVINVDSNGVSSYGISLMFDNIELMLNGSPASTELLPVGLTNLTAGVLLESLGSISTFEAVTILPGPVNTNFLIGTIAFRVRTPTNDSLPDLTPGFFNTGVDGFYDNAGRSVTPTFNSGFLSERGPLLRAFRTTTNSVVVAWPAPSTGFSLQQNLTLATNAWSAETSTVLVVGSENQVIIRPPLGNKFYRLIHP